MLEEVCRLVRVWVRVNSEETGDRMGGYRHDQSAGAGKLDSYLSSLTYGSRSERRGR